MANVHIGTLSVMKFYNEPVLESEPGWIQSSWEAYKFSPST
jgi:hypothetical protein